MKGAEFREIRQRLGLSHKRLGELLGKSKDTMIRREKSERVENEAALAITALAQIARANPVYWRKRVLGKGRRQWAAFLDAHDLHESDDDDVLESVLG